MKRAEIREVYPKSSERSREKGKPGKKIIQAQKQEESSHPNSRVSPKVRKEIAQKATHTREDRRRKAIQSIPIEELAEHLGVREGEKIVCPGCKAKNSLVFYAGEHEFKCKSCKRMGHSGKLVKLSLGLNDWAAIVYLEELAASIQSRYQESGSENKRVQPLEQRENKQAEAEFSEENQESSSNKTVQSLYLENDAQMLEKNLALEQTELEVFDEAGEKEKEEPEDFPLEELSLLDTIYSENAIQQENTAIPVPSPELTESQSKPTQACCNQNISKENFLDKIRQVKQLHRIEDVIEQEAGVRFQKVGSNLVCRCPFPDHEDRNPSFTVSPEKQMYHCFGCGRKGDVLKFLMEYRGYKFIQALNQLGGMEFSSPVKAVAVADEVSLNPGRRKELMTRCRDYFHQRLSESEEAKAFLYKRGLYSAELVSFFKLGFDDGRINRAITTDVLQDMANLGLVNEKNHSRFYQCLTVGLMDGEGNVIGLYGRRVNEGKGSKHQFPRGQVQGILNADAFKASSEMILTEGCLDAFAVWVMGFRNVSCIFSASSIPALLVDQLTRYQVKRVYLALDNDKAGETACERFARALGQIEIELRRICFPSGIKDSNEFLLYYGGEKAAKEFACLIKEAVPFALKKEALPEGQKLKESGAIQWKEKSGLFQGKHLAYQIEILSHERGAMRVLLTASRNGTSYTDKLDMFRSQARQSFVSSASHKFSLPLEPLSAEMETVLSLLRSFPLDQARKENAVKEKTPLYTKEEEEEALRWLHDPQFFQRIPRDCDVLGHVGEDQAKQILYLCATSRKQEKPIPAIVRGLSGGGKTTLMEIIVSLMPPEETCFLSEISRQALFYMNSEQISHKLIVVDESSGSEDAAYAIRTLLSRGVLRKAVTMKDSSGQMQTIFQETQGPIGYMESTTQIFLNQENENRCLIVYLDDSMEQTRRIHEAQRESFTPEGRCKAKEAQHIRRIHQVAQRLLKPCKVDIPYVHLLEFPSHWTRTRRDHSKFLLLLSTIAYLHQYQRRQYRENGQFVVVANIQDYRYACELAPMILLPSVSDLSDKHQELLESIDRYAQERAEKLQIDKSDVVFTRGEISHALNLQLHQLRTYLPLLVDIEYLIQIGNPGKGATFKYRRNYQLPDPTNPMNWLISPDKLEQKLANKDILQPANAKD